MSEISMPKKVSRPTYMIESDIKKQNIKITDEELKVYTIAQHNVDKIKNLEKSNIPDIYENVFKYSVMAWVFEPIDNAVICVDENGIKVNTNEKDYECATCDHFVEDPDDPLVKERYPHGYCSFATNRWIERFGSLDAKPDGFDDFQSKMAKIGENQEQREISVDEIMKLTAGLSGGWVDEMKGNLNKE